MKNQNEAVKNSLPSCEVEPQIIEFHGEMENCKFTSFGGYVDIGQGHAVFVGSTISYKKSK